MKVLRWLDKHFEECFLFFIIWFAVAASFLQIIMRYCFKNSLSWPEELNRYLFIAFSYIALSYSVRYDCYTRIDIIETLAPKLQPTLSFICDAGFFCFCVYLIKPGINVVSQLYLSAQTSSAMKLPMFLVYLPLLLGLMFSILRLIEKYMLKLAIHFHQKGDAKS